MTPACPDCDRGMVAMFSPYDYHSWRWRCETCEPMHPVELPTMSRPARRGAVPSDDPAPRLDIEFVWNANYFTRIRGANWFPVDSLATLGAAIDAIRDHNDREEKDHAP